MTPVLPGSKLTSNFVFYNFVTEYYLCCFNNTSVHVYIQLIRCKEIIFI
jgi:hypothetical protein